MDGRSHDKDVIVTGPSDLDAGIEALKDYVAGITSGENPLDFRQAERRIRVLAAAIECAATASALEACKPAAEVVELDGRRYKRLAEVSEVTYFGMAGGLRVSRHLYREVGVRNGPTIVPMELKAGIVEGLMTPEAAQADAYLAQALPSREAKEAARRLGVLPASRTSMVRVSNAMGQRWEARRLEAEDHLMSTFEVPEEAVALSVSVDRVSVPMEEPRKRRPGRPRKGAPKRPVEVVYRMAYCAVLTLHDDEGKPLHSIRYGRMPGSSASRQIESAAAGDLAAILGQRPDLRVVALADGAPEMQNILDRITCGLPVDARLIDFWHLIEKLAPAIAATGYDVNLKLERWKNKLKKHDHAIEQIEVELRTWGLDYQEDELPDGLYDALTYIENNRDRMRYASVRAAHLPIGSGHVEATCKTIVTTRMKRCGARWKHDGGQAIMHFRSLATSSRWDHAMDFLLETYRKSTAAVRAEAA